MNKSAIVLGATGLTGSRLLRKLLRDERYGRILLFSRSASEIKSAKIEEHLVDLFQLEKHKDQFKADEVFCCIGTTKNKTPDKETYKNIDYGIPVSAAQLCKQNQIPTFAVISAMGADSSSKIFYNRTKGEMEEGVLAQKIQNTYIFKPSLIAGKRKEKRFGENAAKKLMKVFNYILVGPLKKYRSIKPETIAKAMIFVANSNYSNKKIKSDEIKELARK